MPFARSSPQWPRRAASRRTNGRADRPDSAPKRVVLKTVPEKITSWDHRKLGGAY